MASGISDKTSESYGALQSSEKKEDGFGEVRNKIPVPSGAASRKASKWAKDVKEEKTTKAGKRVLKGKQEIKAPSMQFVDTDQLRNEFKARAKADSRLEDKRGNILGTIELLIDAKNILTGNKLEYKHYNAHKRKDKNLERVCQSLQEGVSQAYMRAEDLGFSSYFFSEVLPKDGCYEKTTAKINDHNLAFESGGSLFLKEMARIYCAEKGAALPVAFEAFQEFLEPFAQKFSYTKEDFEILETEGVLVRERPDRGQEIMNILNDAFFDWTLEAKDEIRNIGLFKAYVREKAEENLSEEEMEKFDEHLDAFFKFNTQAEKLLIHQSTEWF